MPQVRRYYAVIAKFIVLADSEATAKARVCPFRDDLENVVQGVPLSLEARDATAAELKDFGLEFPKEGT